MWCLFAGGGIRDSWNNLVEKTSDAGGMYISTIEGVFKSLSYRWKTYRGPENHRLTGHSHLINHKLVTDMHH